MAPPIYLCLDLEVHPSTQQILSLGAVRSDQPEGLRGGGRTLSGALDALDAMAAGADAVLGHNIIDFDLPRLKAARPGSRIHGLPALDTLRLNPLAFPRNPYHHLVKHYKDGDLVRSTKNDPEQDARLALDLFRDQERALLAISPERPELLSAWHWLTSHDGLALDALFERVRGAPCPSDVAAYEATRGFLATVACSTHIAELLDACARPDERWPIAFALAWISVAGGNSAMPPWVRHTFPRAPHWVRRLRDQACGACAWCHENHNPQRALERWFGYPDFRPEPADKDGRPLQRRIVEAAMAGEHVLGILPTGTGKSVCYQIPALSKYENTGALTVVISPLVALMADQVAGLEARGIHNAAALNGLLSPPERADVLERIRMGEIGILLVAPEQLRSKGCLGALEQREVGAWVLDEAHCISKWGHDFRPDYRYVGRFIKQSAKGQPLPLVLCLTATAKKEVVQDIVQHFKKHLEIELLVLDGGTQRENLTFEVHPTTEAQKMPDIASMIESCLAEAPGGAIVYCATQRRTAAVADFLVGVGIEARPFHADLDPELKKSTQADFISGTLRVIAATNAFGMGIDKPDVRLVVHADVPGSLENYLQEAGRAGRDRRAARCALLYTPDDVDRQFGMSARGRLTRKEIQAVLRALNKLGKKTDGHVIATPQEIITRSSGITTTGDDGSDGTRVRTAVAWLEEAGLLEQNENETHVFPSSLRITSLEQAERRLRGEPAKERTLMLELVRAILEANPTSGVSTDSLMIRTRRSSEAIRRALHRLESLGIANNDTRITALLDIGVANSSSGRLAEAESLERDLIELLRIEAPDLEPGQSSLLYLRSVSQRLQDRAHRDALQDRVLRLLRSIAADGRGEHGGKGSLHIRTMGDERVRVTLLREWDKLERTAALRRAAARVVLRHFLGRAAQLKGTDRLVDTTHGDLRRALESDIEIRSEMRDAIRLMERALMWLHEQGVLRLQKGLNIFRSAMTIELDRSKRMEFTKADFRQLGDHYVEQTIQIHVMAEYATRGLRAMAEALRLAMDYFALGREEFIARWLAHKRKELARQTTPESWTRIVDALGNREQQQIVADDQEDTNVLVLAGPGSGKTRVLVHRIAYLVRVRREAPRSIIALAYNRHAVGEIRRRLHDLIGDDALWVTVLTFHALALKLTGRTMEGRQAQLEDGAFKEVFESALGLLRANPLASDEDDAQRDHLLGGFRWILVDEYQDVDEPKYELISLLAGRARARPDQKLSLFAVGDDDQNIYAFAGASIEYIRRFEQDYASRPAFLLSNYRSSGHIIAAAQALIRDAKERMKVEHELRVDGARRRLAPGGAWAELDPVAKGRVQILQTPDDILGQAVCAMEELVRLSQRGPRWSWADTAVIAREWSILQPVQAWCAHHGIQAVLAHDEGLPLWRLRQTQALLAAIETERPPTVDATRLHAWLDEQPHDTWIDLLKGAVDDFALEVGDARVPSAEWRDYLADWGRRLRRRPRCLTLLTAHSAKGLEFEHVVVLDGSWLRRSQGEDQDAPRRLLYVAMTRARQTLLLCRRGAKAPLLDGLLREPSVVYRRAPRPDVSGPWLSLRRERLSPAQVDLSFAGRFAPEHPTHRALAALQVGDPLTVRHTEDGKVQLLDQHGEVVGRLAQSYAVHLDEVESAQVAAIIEWRKEDSDPQYQGTLRCTRWEVVLPELCIRSPR